MRFPPCADGKNQLYPSPPLQINKCERGTHRTHQDVAPMEKGGAVPEVATGAQPARTVPGSSPEKHPDENRYQADPSKAILSRMLI